MTDQNVDDSSFPEPAEQADEPKPFLLRDDVQRAAEALLRLGSSSPELARSLMLLAEVVAEEAARTPRFSRALTKALAAAVPAGPERASERGRNRSRRRAKGLLDPFAVFTEVGPEGLRKRLGTLDLEQLRDIIAEHGMDYDRLAMKWKDPQRVMERIVERVEARSAKGSAFRAPTRGPADAGD
ncbi:hypothetical protein [Streptomyces eurythermus]|uniref:hypothetical protein n=1 Tax=Streptomyces eurythermus TaxID=42237 RepID=UPI0036FBDF39